MVAHEVDGWDLALVLRIFLWHVHLPARHLFLLLQEALRSFALYSFALCSSTQVRLLDYFLTILISILLINATNLLFVYFSRCFEVFADWVVRVLVFKSIATAQVWVMADAARVEDVARVVQEARIIDCLLLVAF